MVAQNTRRLAVENFRPLGTVWPRTSQWSDRLDATAVFQKKWKHMKTWSAKPFFSQPVCSLAVAIRIHGNHHIGSCQLGQPYCFGKLFNMMEALSQGQSHRIMIYISWPHFQAFELEPRRKRKLFREELASSPLRPKNNKTPRLDSNSVGPAPRIGGNSNSSPWSFWSPP